MSRAVLLPHLGMGLYKVEVPVLAGRYMVLQGFYRGLTRASQVLGSRVQGFRTYRSEFGVQCLVVSTSLVHSFGNVLVQRVRRFKLGSGNQNCMWNPKRANPKRDKPQVLTTKPESSLLN